MSRHPARWSRAQPRPPYKPPCGTCGRRRGRNQAVRELSQRQVAAMAVRELEAEIAWLRQQIAGRTATTEIRRAAPVGEQGRGGASEAPRPETDDRLALADGARAQRS